MRKGMRTRLDPFRAGETEPGLLHQAQLNGDWESAVLGGDINRPRYCFCLDEEWLAHSRFGWGSEYSSLNSPKSWADGINWNAHIFHTFASRWASYLPVSPSALFILTPQQKKNWNTRCLRKHTLSSRHIFDPWPPVEQHRAMMVHMQKSDLFLFLAQNKENLKEARQGKILSCSV